MYTTNLLLWCCHDITCIALLQMPSRLSMNIPFFHATHYVVFSLQYYKHVVMTVEKFISKVTL